MIDAMGSSKAVGALPVAQHGDRGQNLAIRVGRAVDTRCGGFRGSASDVFRHRLVSRAAQLPAVLASPSRRSARVAAATTG